MYAVTLKARSRILERDVTTTAVNRIKLVGGACGDNDIDEMRCQDAIAGEISECHR